MSVDELVAAQLQSGLSDQPLLETLVRMQADNQARSGLDDRTYVLVRLAGLAALDASPTSFLTHIAIADEVGITLEEVRGVLIALAPLIGSVRALSAAGHAQQVLNG